MTYGEFEWLDLRELWDTGFERRGGMILLKGCKKKAFKNTVAALFKGFRLVARKGLEPPTLRV